MGANKNSCKTAAVMNLLSRGTGDRVLPAQPKEAQTCDIEVLTQKYLAARRTTGEGIITMGQVLIEAKAALPHGAWLTWLTERLDTTERMAQRFMRAATYYSNPTTLSDLGLSKALMLLTLPDGEREEFIEVPHAVNGEEKKVTDMSVRELQAAIKERDAALRAAAEAKAEQSAAEQARKKISQDMAIANERIAGLNAEVEEHSARAKEAQEAAARLERELAELRTRPVEVAVEADPAAIEAARKEAEAAMQAKLDRAELAKAKAEDRRKAAEEAKAAAQAELERAQAEAQTLREQAARAEKQAALTSDADLVLFEELMGQSQTVANRMRGIILKKQGKDPETAGKLRNAAATTWDRCREVTQG